MKSVRASLWRISQKSKTQKCGESESDDVGGERCHRVRTGRANIDGIGIREGWNASRWSAAATTALCLGLRGGRAAVQDGKVYRDLTVFRVRRASGSIVPNWNVDLCVGFGFGGKEEAAGMLLSLAECLLAGAMT